MYQIEQITSDPWQTQTLVLPDGSTIKFTIRFRPMQYGWFIDELTYADFPMAGQRICVSPNILRQYKSSLPFGIGVFTSLTREPTQADDFSSGNFKMYVLTPAEVQAFEDYLARGL